MANGQNFQIAVQAIEAFSALVVASGLIPIGVRWFTARGIDAHAVLNSSFVAAAYNAGLSVLKDLAVNGANLKDPKVIADAIAAVRNTLNNTHAETISNLGASPGDVARISADQTRAALVAITQAPAPAQVITLPNAPGIEAHVVGDVAHVTIPKI